MDDVSFKFKLLTIAKELEPFVLNFQTIRNEKIKEYGTEGEDGTIAISIDDRDAIQKFSDDMNPLLNTDITVNMTKLNATEAFNKGLSSEQLVDLYEIIEE